MKEIEEIGIVINMDDIRSIAKGLAEVVEKVNEIIRQVNRENEDKE